MVAVDDPTIEGALVELAGQVTQMLGPRLVGIYLEGSFAWGNPVATSDLDLRVVTTAPVADELRAGIDAARHAAMTRLGREVGVQFEALEDLIRIGAVRFQRSRLIAGRDIRPQVPLKPLAAFARDSLSSARRLATSLRQQHDQPTTFPLGLPDPGAEFRGYQQQHILDRGEWVPSSKRLVSNVLAVATARVAAAGHYVYAKGEVPAAYRQHIGDDWSTLVEDVYATCRTRFAYRLPTETADRGHLTALCERATAFENTLMRLSPELARGEPPG